MVKRAIATVALLAAHLAPCVALAETYQHGYLEYEVVDQSVTITGYVGREQAVTVPAMIGGNPVNAVASGAFAGADAIEAVYLPDTVTSVEAGAFAPGQAVVFVGRAGGDEAGEGARGTDAAEGDEVAGGGEKESGEASEKPKGEGASQGAGAAQTVFVLLRGGSLVAVDDEGHLVLVDPSGNERVLDDTRTYERQTREDGTLAIVDVAGREVVVADGSEVSFTDADGFKTVVDAASGTTTVTSEDSSYGDEEVDIDDEADEQASESKGAGALPALAGVAAIAGVGAVLWVRRKGRTE